MARWVAAVPGACWCQQQQQGSSGWFLPPSHADACLTSTPLVLQVVEYFHDMQHMPPPRPPPAMGVAKLDGVAEGTPAVGLPQKGSAAAAPSSGNPFPKI